MFGEGEKETVAVEAEGLDVIRESAGDKGGHPIAGNLPAKGVPDTGAV